MPNIKRPFNNAFKSGNAAYGGGASAFEGNTRQVTEDSLTLKHLDVNSLNLLGQSIEDRYVNVTGDTMTGNLNINNDKSLNFNRNGSSTVDVGFTWTDGLVNGAVSFDWATSVLALTADQILIAAPDGIDLNGFALSDGTLTGITADDLTNDIHAQTVHAKAFNNSGATINRGSAVYVSGYNTGQDALEIKKADANDTTAMPAFGITEDDISTGNVGEVVVTGLIEGFNTSSWNTGDNLYVDTTAGALTNTKPTGLDTAVQKVAIVLKKGAQGSILVFGAGRSNDIPNKTDRALDMGGFKITSLAEPTTLSGAATKQYVDLKQGNVYQAHAGRTNPADNTTYEYGNAFSTAPITTAVATAEEARFYIMKDGIISGANATFKTNGTLATNETSTVYIRKNDTTDITISSGVQCSGAWASYTNYTLNTPVSRGDFLTFKWITPAWTTNPTNVNVGGFIYIE